MFYSDDSFSNVYSQMIYDNSFVNGGCNMLYNWIGALVDTNVTQYGLQSIIFLQVNDLHSSNYHIGCSSEFVSKQIIKNLVSKTESSSSSIPLTSYCDGHNWVVNKCTSKVSICVDCLDPCISSSSTKRISPCFSNADIHDNQITVLATVSSRAVSGPQILDISISTAGISNVSVSVSLNAAAFIYCAGYAQKSDLDVRSESIVRDGVMVAAVNSPVQVDLANLHPSTDYKVYCFAQKSPVYHPSQFVRIVSQSFRTSCCRPIYFGLRYPLVVNVKENYISNFLTISAGNVFPGDIITISLVVLDAQNMPSLSCTFSPPSIIFKVLNSSNTFTYASNLFGCAVGEYTVRSDKSILSGNNVNAFQIKFDTPNAFSVVREFNTAPTMLSASFSSDLSAVIVYFDMSIDTKSFSPLFDCSSIFMLPRGSRHKCRWNDVSMVYILMAFDSDIIVGDRIDLLSKSVKASGSSSYASAQTIAILSPTDPVSPDVVINCPTILSYCQDLNIDLSSSSGSGGRLWQSVSVVVSTNPALSSSLVTNLNTYLQSKLSRVAMTVTIPSSYLAPNYDFIFSVTMCNFVGKCGSDIHVTTVSTRKFPMAILPGPSFETFSRSDTISFSAPSVANVTTCNSDYEIVFSWSLLLNGEVEEVQILSSGSDPFKFHLVPYSLNSSTYYSLKLNIFDAISLSSSSIVKSIYVYESPVVAMISGGSVRLLSSEVNYIFDGSQSYDDNLPQELRQKSGLLYSWSCISLYPIYSTFCPLSFLNDKLSLVSINAATMLQGYKLELQLLVSDESGSRSASTSVYLEIIGEYLPTVSISTVGAPSSLFANSKLKLYGTVSWMPSFDTSDLNASWTVSDPFVDLATLSLSPTHLPLSKGTSSKVRRSNSLSSCTVNLVLLSSGLSVRNSYTFSLSLIGTTGVISTTSLVVIRNLPPSPGIFVVTPASGFEFSTLFKFSGTHWNDVDLPLSYVFGYVSIGNQQGNNSI